MSQATSILKDTEVAVIEPPAAAGTSDLTSDAIDMANAEAVTCLWSIGTITSGAVTSLKAQQSSDDGATDAYSDLAGSAVTIADTQSDKVAVLEVRKPAKRYIKFVLDRGTQNAVSNGAIAVKTGLRVRPSTQPASVMAASKVLAGPDEGTA